MFTARRIDVAASCVALILAALPTARPASAAPDTAAEQIARGDQLYAQAKLGEARDAYQAALKAAPNHFVALYRLAQVESELGEDAKGEERARLVAAGGEHARGGGGAGPPGAPGHGGVGGAPGGPGLEEGAHKEAAPSRGS